MAVDHPVTLAVRALREHGVSFVPHLFAYQERGGTRWSSRALGVDEHLVIKTLIFEDDDARPLCVLMHGDREVSQKALARALGKKRVAPASPAAAERWSGYKVGGTSPFGLRTPMPLYAERSVLALARLYVNGGARGFLVELATSDLARVLAPVPVDAATS